MDCVFFTLAVLFCSCHLLPASEALTPSSHLTAADKERLKTVFTAALAGGEDLAITHFAIRGLELLGETVPEAQKLCEQMKPALRGSDLEGLYYAAVAGKAAKCNFKVTSEAEKLLKTYSDSSAADVHFAVLAQKALGKKVDSATVLKNLPSALKKDDSLSSLGFAFRTAASLEGVDVKAIFDRINDAVVQADEVDGKMLQFEGGLSATNFILSGAFELAAKHGKAPPIGKMQTVKFANYFLNRRSVQTAKGGFNLLEAMNTLTTNKFVVPVSISLTSPAVVSAATPKVQVSVTDLFGKSLGAMSLQVESAMRQSDGAIVLSKGKMSPVAADGSTYEIDLMAAKPGRGFYELTVNAEPQKPDSRLAGNTGAILLVKALGKVTVTGAEVGVVDADQTTAPKLTALTHPTKSAKLLQADHHHKVIFKFALTDGAAEKIRVHQAFVRLLHVQSGAEIIFVAEPDAANVYRFDLDLGAKAKDFGGRTGKYEMHLIVGDATVSNPVSWHLTDLELKLQEVASSDQPSSATTGPKPEIRHKFREPEVLPPPTVSTMFTLLCLLPILVMLVGWYKIGVNVSGFPLSLSAVGFHFFLAAIFTLYVYFWLNLNMFTTLKYLIMLGVVTFICGNSMLVKIAEKRKGSSP